MGTGRTEIISALIDAGADMNVKDGSGLTPMQLAAKNGHKDLVTMLLAKAKALKNKNK
jgi:ankyrin repeat protein